jgi:hypothetical protein
LDCGSSDEESRQHAGRTFRPPPMKPLKTTRKKPRTPGGFISVALLILIIHSQLIIAFLKSIKQTNDNENALSFRTPETKTSIPAKLPSDWSAVADHGRRR